MPEINYIFSFQLLKEYSNISEVSNTLIVKEYYHSNTISTLIVKEYYNNLLYNNIIILNTTTVFELNGLLVKNYTNNVLYNNVLVKDYIKLISSNHPMILKYAFSYITYNHIVINRIKEINKYYLLAKNTTNSYGLNYNVYLYYAVGNFLGKIKSLDFKLNSEGIINELNILVCDKIKNYVSKKIMYCYKNMVQKQYYIKYNELKQGQEITDDVYQYCSQTDILEFISKENYDLLNGDYQDLRFYVGFSFNQNQDDYDLTNVNTQSTPIYSFITQLKDTYINLKLFNYYFSGKLNTVLLNFETLFRENRCLPCLKIIIVSYDYCYYRIINYSLIYDHCHYRIRLLNLDNIIQYNKYINYNIDGCLIKLWEFSYLSLQYEVIL